MLRIRKLTLLWRQLVRRSMLFSAVQISMPGTSCATACPINVSVIASTALDFHMRLSRLDLSARNAPFCDGHLNAP